MGAAIPYRARHCRAAKVGEHSELLLEQIQRPVRGRSVERKKQNLRCVVRILGGRSE